MLTIWTISSIRSQGIGVTERCGDAGYQTQNDVRLMVCWTAQAVFRSTHNAALRKSN